MFDGARREYAEGAYRKKLIDAGRWWAAPGETDADLEFYDLEYEVGDDRLFVFEENWPALQIFLDCATQWRPLPMGGVSGLNYQSLDTVMGFHAIAAEERLSTFQKIRSIESGALDAMRERAALEQAKQVKPNG